MSKPPPQGIQASEPASALAQAAPVRQLSLVDSTSIIVGIIIGVGIYRSSPDIAANVPGPYWLIGVWLLGGLLSMIGALCYAELATAYPKSGGDYVFITRAFGRAPGFLFAWAQLWVIRPGSIGGVAYVFAEYANQLYPLATGQHKYLALIAYAAAVVVILTLINVAGVREGKWTQNVLTTLKVLGPVVIFAVGMLCPASDPGPTQPRNFAQANFYLAMILVLWTYGGWSEMGFVAAEVRRPDKNIVRALILGTLAVTLIYVLINVAFLRAMGFQGARSATVAADVLQKGFGDWAGRLMSLVICISALGAVNGNIFTGARIYYALGTEHRLFAALGRWHPRWGTPARSLLAQGLVTLLLVIGFGLTQSGFQSMVEFTTPIFWAFFLLVGFSLFVLRYTEPHTPRPFRVPLYPVVPVLFCLSSLFMLYGSLAYALTVGKFEPLWAIAIMLVGVALCLVDRRPGP